MSMSEQKILLKVERKNGNTYLSNGLGNSWTIPHVDNDTAIGTLVFFTMKHAFEKYTCLADSFEIEMTMNVQINDNNEKG